MATISVSNIADGDAVTAASINNQVNTIVNDYNGNITAANLASNAVTTPKITDANVTGAKIATATVTGNNLVGTNIWGVAGAQLGGTASPAAKTGQFYIQTGNVVGVTDASGHLSITYPTAFPNGVLVCIPTDGTDATNRPCNIYFAGTNNASTFSINHVNASTSIRIFFIAIGY